MAANEKIRGFPPQKFWSGPCYGMFGSMRIFVLASLSTNVIAASNNAAKLPAKSNAADSKNATDGSPFGAMLAATASEQVKQQAARPVSDDEHQAAAKKSDTTSNDPSKEHGDAAAPQASPARTNAVKTSTDKTSDGKASNAKPADTADSKAPAKDSANDNSGADQTAQVQQPPVPPAQVPPQPDLSALMLAQGAQPATATPAAAANGDGGTVVGANSGKTSAAATAAPAGSILPDAAAQAVADGAAPQAPSASSNSSGSSPGSFKSQLATIKGAAVDGKTAATQGSEKTASKTADTTAQPQTQQAQVTPQTPPPAAPANNDNAAAVPALNFSTPVQNNADTTVSNSIQVSAHAPDTAGTLGTLAVAIAAKTQSGARQFDIRLDPPELGRVEVRLSIDASGKTEAHMTADRPETLNLLQKDSSSLTQALRDAGLDVSQSGLNFSLRGQNGQSADNGSGRRANLTASRAIDAAQGAVQGATPAISFTGGGIDGRLDIHV
jgi:flagellar hook-length control protein FliK